MGKQCRYRTKSTKIMSFDKLSVSIPDYLLQRSLFPRQAIAAYFYTLVMMMTTGCEANKLSLTAEGRPRGFDSAVPTESPQTPAFPLLCCRGNLVFLETKQKHQAVALLAGLAVLETPVLEKPHGSALSTFLSRSHS